METLLLDHEAVGEHTPMADLVPAIEEAFAADARGNTVMPSKTYIDLPDYEGDFRSMPAYLRTDEWDAAGVKWVNVHPGNPERFDLPTVLGTMIYSDPKNAYPLAIMDGTELTGRRTGAAAAVATDHLAVEDADSLGLVGAGAQSYAQLEAIATVREIEEVVVHDRSEASVERFVEAFADEFDVRAGSVADAGHCDVLSTVTPVESPIVSASDVGESTHVNAIGADAPGKHELADDLLKAATLVVDNYEQSIHSGEVNVPWAAGVLTDADIHATLGEVVTGRKRVERGGRTVFDSTGLAIQDVAGAHVAYRNASAAGEGVGFDLLGV
jgi:alanine dehydrogenase